MRGISKYLSLCLLMYHKSLISQLVKEFELISNNKEIGSSGIGMIGVPYMRSNREEFCLLCFQELWVSSRKGI